MLATITDKPQYAFVYGTLRRGQERDINRLQPAPLFIGNSQIKGTLYDLGSYPGVRLGGGAFQNRAAPISQSCPVTQLPLN